MLWIVEMPWVAACMGGTEYEVWNCTKEQAALGLAAISKRGPNDRPHYDPDFRLYQAEVIDPGTMDLSGEYVPAGEFKEVNLVEEAVENPYCFIEQHTGQHFGPMRYGRAAKSLEEFAIYQTPGSTFRLVKGFRWKDAEVM